MKGYLQYILRLQAQIGLSRDEIDFKFQTGRKEPFELTKADADKFIQKLKAERAKRRDPE